MAHARVLIGTSGFSYPHWKEVFYPHGLKPSEWLQFYAGAFKTIELNSTFYHLPSESSVRSWASSTPADFVFAVKLSRFITHIKRLRGIGDSLELFLSRAKILGGHLGPILIQLPPTMTRDEDLLEGFLEACGQGMQWAVEFRSPTWLTASVYSLLRRHGVALCIHDMLDDHPMEVTAPFAYIRFHGTNQRYGGDYPDAALGEWAGRIRRWSEAGIGVYAYFNNDAEGFALKNARSLIERLAG